MTRDLAKCTVVFVLRYAPRGTALLDRNGPALARRILVVDDEPLIRRLLCDLFTSEGYLVSQAADGEQALQQLQSALPDIVVLDLMMPVMSGLEFVARSRHIHGCAELPIILVSAMYDAVRTATWLSGTGINACLGKPFDIQELLALVELHARPITTQPAALPLDMRRALENPLRMLLVLDQPAVAGVARLTLNHGACETRTVTNGADAAAALASWQPHLLLFDMELGGATVMQLVSAGQPGVARLPVIGLTRRGDLKMKLAAFEAGVEDILRVPFGPEELLARVIAVVRRSYGDSNALTPVIEIGQLELDILNRTARTRTSELRLTPLEQSLLYLLASSAGRVVSRKEINNILWGADFVAKRGSADWQVRNLRSRLLNVSGRHDFIATVPGRGYRFVPLSVA
jgi:two-component system, OmpR family, response regulator